jgi:hypothetical protein
VQGTAIHRAYPEPLGHPAHTVRENVSVGYVRFDTTRFFGKTNTTES